MSVFLQSVSYNISKSIDRSKAMGNRTVMLSLVVLLSTVEIGLGRNIAVGRRIKVKDVKANQEVQDLGRYAVKQYNLQRQISLGDSNNDDIGELKFKDVVEAEKQVVSGIKYYLKIDTKSTFGVHSTFDAVVLVKPWVRSKELLHFDYSSSHESE